MTASKTATTTSRNYAVERPTAGNMAAVAPVLAAVWCRSVGTSWTLELHQLNGGTASGTIVNWIGSGVPISQPAPDALARDLLAEHGLQLFGDSSAGPRTHNRHGIGYACRNAELIKLAHLVRDDAKGTHPVVLATHWIAAGFSADVAAGWIRQGVHAPQAVQQQTVCSEPTVSEPTHTSTLNRPLSRLRNRTCGRRGAAALRTRRCPCRNRP